MTRGINLKFGGGLLEKILKKRGEGKKEITCPTSWKISRGDKYINSLLRRELGPWGSHVFALV